MFHILNTGIARGYGVNAALVAQYIYVQVNESLWRSTSMYRSMKTSLQAGINTMGVHGCVQVR